MLIGGEGNVTELQEPGVKFHKVIFVAKQDPVKIQSLPKEPPWNPVPGHRKGFSYYKMSERQTMNRMHVLPISFGWNTQDKLV